MIDSVAAARARQQTLTGKTIDAVPGELSFGQMNSEKMGEAAPKPTKQLDLFGNVVTSAAAPHGGDMKSSQDGGDTAKDGQASGSQVSTDPTNTAAVDIFR